MKGMKRIRSTRKKTLKLQPLLLTLNFHPSRKRVKVITEKRNTGKRKGEHIRANLMFKYTEVAIRVKTRKRSVLRKEECSEEREVY